MTSRVAVGAHTTGSQSFSNTRISATRRNRDIYLSYTVFAEVNIICFCRR